MGRNRRGKNPKAQEIRQGPALEGDAVMKKCTSIILVAGDGTGDGLVELPNMLMIRLGWCVGDTLAVDLLPGGKIHVQLIAPKKDKFARP